MLGIVIGITALISVASILVGLDRDMRGFLEDYGADTLFVFKFSPGIHIGRLSMEERMRKPLTLEAAVIQGSCPAVKEIVVEIFPRFTGGPMAAKTARYQGQEVFDVDHTGALASYEQVYNARMEQGRFFSEAEDLHREDVVVVGHDLADALFPGGHALGKTIIVDSVPYRILGVLEPRKGQFFKDQSADRNATVPYHTYQKHHPQDDENFIGVTPYENMKAQAEDEIRELLRRRRRVAYDKPDNFGISSAEAIAVQFRQITGSGGADPRGHQFDRAAGGRRRGDEHHADVGDRTHAGDRRAQGHRRPPPRHHLAIPYRGRHSDRERRRHWRAAGRRDQRPNQPVAAVSAFRRAVLGGGGRRAGFHERRNFLRNVPSGARRPPRPRRSPALRVRVGKGLPFCPATCLPLPHFCYISDLRGFTRHASNCPLRPDSGAQCPRSRPLPRRDQGSHDPEARRSDRAGGRSRGQVLCLQELFYGPYFCAEQEPRWYELAESVPEGPSVRRMQELAAKHHMVMVVPVYEETMPGFYFNTAAVIDADGRYLGKYRKHHIPHCHPGFWEKFYFTPGDLGYPVFETKYAKVGVYICYDRHFPEGARALGLNGAEIVFNPSATVAGLSEYLWELEQPAHAVANRILRRPPSTAWAKRSRGASASSTARVTSAIRAGRSSPRPAATRTKCWSPTSIST